MLRRCHADTAPVFFFFLPDITLRRATMRRLLRYAVIASATLMLR